MALNPAPAFIGKVIVSSTNNVIPFYENSTLYSPTIALGEYFPEDLATLIQTAMDGTASSNTYTVSFDKTSGLTGIDRATGTNTFAPDVGNVAVANLWIGGASDSDGNTWGTGQHGAQHFGYKVDTVTETTSFTSPNKCGGVWYPLQPPISDTLNQIQSTNTTESFALDGSSIVFDFTTWETSNNSFLWADTSYGANNNPTFVQKNQKRTLQFDFISSSSRGEYITNFWGPWAKSGNIFRLYSNPGSSGNYINYRLTDESLRTNTFTDRRVQYAYYTGQIVLARM